ncbi:hypothetical protein GCM10009117_08360 [Gangjinia marincola]|uniref:Nitroreductase domain-containing protein n=1 Tax=Gangjinia marincola TaxID=578463 RepID=A0ABN1MEX7_9FLAO
MNAKETDLLKKTPTEYDIHPLIKNRWSPRKFADTPITETDLNHLFEAGRWAPSCYNWQPWRIVWGIKGSETYDRIFSHLSEFNKDWVINAPVLLLTAYKKTTPEGKDNFHALHDLGQFVAMMSIQAQHMGIAVHQMAGVNPDKAKAEFGFPEEYHVATAVALGHYGGDMDDLSDDLKDQEKAERSRNRVEYFTFQGNYVDRAELDK